MEVVHSLEKVNNKKVDSPAAVGEDNSALGEVGNLDKVEETTLAMYCLAIRSPWKGGSCCKEGGCVG